MPDAATADAKKSRQERAADADIVPGAFASGARNAPAPAAAPAPSGGSSLAGYSLAALIGALVALGAYWLLDRAATGEDGDPQAAFTELDTRLAALEGREETSVDLAPIEQRLAESESRIEALAAAPQAETVDPARIDEITGQIDTLGSEVQGMAEQIAALEASGDELEPLRAEIATLGETFAALDARIAAAEQATEDERQASDERAAIGVALAQLQGALLRGQPFAPELDAIDRFDSISDESVAQLRPYAESGLRTPDALARAFDAGAIAQAADPQERNVVDRLLGGARSLVRVAPAGTVEGEGTDAIVSRIEAALQTGDLATALQEWEALPEPARQASADWAEEIRARLAAEGLVADMASLALGGEAEIEAAPETTGATPGADPQPAPETNGQTGDGAAQEGDRS